MPFCFFTEFDNSLKKRVVPHQALDSGTFIIQLIQYLIETAILFPDEIPFIYADVIEENLSPSFAAGNIDCWTNGDTGQFTIDDKFTNALLFWRRRVRPRDKIDVSHIHRATGPHFLSADDVIFAVFHRSGLERRQVGTGFRFTHPQADTSLTFENLRQHFPLLFFRTVYINGTPDLPFGKPVAGSRCAVTQHFLR